MTYLFENRSAYARAVYLSLPLGPNATITGADEVDFDSTTSTPIAVTRVGPKISLRTRDRDGRGPGVNPSLRVDHGREADEGRGVPAAGCRRQSSRDGGRRDRARSKRRGALASRATEELAAIEKELERLREDSKAVGGERGAATPPELVKRLLAAEDRHAAARKRLDGLETEVKTRTERVRARWPGSGDERLAGALSPSTPTATPHRPFRPRSALRR